MERFTIFALREELQSKGHHFTTQSDTEVLVHLYEQEGRRLVDRLRGMFAFAIWDSKKRRLVLARDRVGLKPLFIYRDRDKLIFASELKGILAHPDLDLTVDLDALNAYLTYGFVPGEMSIFRQVRKLAPGHIAEVSHETVSEPFCKRYWSFQPSVRPDLSLEQWLEAIHDKIDETVLAHQIADVPVGAFLSGGLDSSAMVEAQSRQSAKRIKTFSIGFREERFSELPYARQVAARFGTEHFEEIVTPAAVETLETLIHYYDEPFADTSAIPSMHVARLAREHVKVVISGDGGDEAFGGYRRYAHDLTEARVRRMLPEWLRSRLLRPLGVRWPQASRLPRALRWKTALTNLSLEADQAYANTVALCRLPLRRRLLKQEVQTRLSSVEPEQIVAQFYGRDLPHDALAAMTRADINVLLPDDFLTKVDRASMSCGLEVRPPLVDHELMELAAQIPSKWKIRKGQTKWILKRLYRDRLPDGIADRRKTGFEIPVDEWLSGPLRELFESTVLDSDSHFAQWIDLDVVRQLYDEHLRHIQRHGAILWALLILAAWSRKYLGARVADRAYLTPGGDIVDAETSSLKN